jgi:hypothetical protein
VGPTKKLKRLQKHRTSNNNATTAMTVRLTGVIVTLLAITLITIVATVAASAAVAASPPPSTKDAACCHPAPPDLILRQKCYGPRVTNTSQHPTNPADFLVVAESVWRANLSPAPFEYWLNATLHKLSTKSLSEPSNALEEVVKPQEKKKGSASFFFQLFVWHQTAYGRRC